jgi:hypothetical protein
VAQDGLHVEAREGLGGLGHGALGGGGIHRPSLARVASALGSWAVDAP